MAILKPKSSDKTRTFSVRIPVDLVAEIDAIKVEADAAGLVFDVADIVHKALSVAVKSARAELSTSCRQSVGTLAGGLAQAAYGGGVREDGGASDRRDGTQGTDA